MIAMEKYTPEMMIGLMVLVKNIILICASAWTTVTLYKLSSSWNCLWALTMLLFIGNQKFIRKIEKPQGALTP